MSLPRGLGLALVVAGLGVLLGLTERRILDWQDEVTIWQAAVEVDGSPTAHQTLEMALFERGQGRAAEGHFRAEARQRPDRLVSHIMLGLALSHRGASAEAEAEWAIVRRLAAERFRPGVDPAVANRGDMIQGVILPPQPDLARKIGLTGAAPDARP